MKVDLSACVLWLGCCTLLCEYAVRGHSVGREGVRQRVQALLGHPVSHATSRQDVVVHKQPETVRRPVAPPHVPRPPSTPHRTYADTVRLLYGMKDVSLPEQRERRGPLYSQEIEDVRMASEHFLRIRTTARCRLPKTRVVYVKDYYSDPSKEYLPSCTVLHRCGDDTGCCDSEQYKCVPRAIQEVTLYFYTIQLQNQNGEVGFRNSVSKLLFTNHTECECQPINDIPRSSSRHSKAVVTQQYNQHSNTLPIALPLQSPAEPLTTTSLQDVNSTVEPPSPDLTSLLKCHKCPKPFARRLYEDSRCSCDCFEKHKPCLRIKRGRDILGELQRRCVEIQECHVPECEYGLYDVETGRCPKKPDHLPKHVEQRRQHPYSHRWQFLERD
ncbi:uncharacterized protein LOC135394596 [Ornithodoros turicata]|uniref:uncharacterized protein LOC135394596 n=1 Tax=Ornithodoros turicata TaxID=34597 RepID=UPI0031397361